MSLVVLKLGQGTWQEGFPSVTVQLWSEGQVIPTQFVGSLPAAPELARLYEQWQSLYAALNQQLNLRRSSLIEIEPEGITHVSGTLLEAECERLKQHLDRWLESDSFRKVDRRLRTYLAPADEIRVLIETEHPLLRRFPWHLWSFFEDYPLAEVALSAPEYCQPDRAIRAAAKVRILAILGNSTGINIQQDRALLEQLPEAETVFLVEPTRLELDRQLWDAQGWDVLFFAGHSTSQPDGTTGAISVNPTEKLTVAQLKNALNAAIQRGLQFAIFNSCDGLGLARALADLNLPQLIVMREPVPDLVAQTFLTHFLTAFSQGNSFYRSVRQAREQLQGLESQFPCASWLPVICQNPAVVPADWQSLVKAVSATPVSTEIASERPASVLPAPVSRRRGTLKRAAFISLAVSGLVMTLRWLGGLQTLELKAFDHLMQLRPPEVTDARVLVVEVTEADTNQYGYPLPDQTLAQLLQQLTEMNPRAIGLDMHRYQPRGAGRAALLQQFQQHDHLFLVCWSASTDKNFAPPPEFSDAQRIEQVGFSDLLLDGTEDSNQNWVRRQLLSYDPKVANAPPDCSTPYSLSFQTVFRFLHEVGQPLEVNAEQNWQSGNVAFRRLPARFVGYQNLDGLSSQVMIHYRSGQPAQRVTLEQVLNGDISRNFVEDRLVLIGTTAPIARDAHLTPNGEMPGIWIHAHMTSQMLSAILDQRPLIWGLPQTGAMQWGDALWVGLWAAMGAGLTWYFRSLKWLLLAIGLALVVLYQVCWLIMTQAGWLPLVPAALSLAGTSASVWGSTKFKQNIQSSGE
jgi:CHASE2 domain-containing sensor protein